MKRLVWGLVGAVIGGVATLGVGLLAAEVFSISQAEGAYAMGLIFFWVPAGAMAGLIVGLLLPRRG